ncbi:glycosyltransferase [Streptococcus danieliae]|uniref:glycosyltransferase n=1 Tax=Streptococcus danieliae TaxID=747656 RepID=UPI0021C59A57|nr:glycosyltransferase family 2 protein [Streptococcus danieliae]MCU0082027.1 glycosyltransferase family 2 protein [Streptococcus danieliae]
MNVTCSCMILNYNDAGTVMKLIEEIKDFPVFHRILIVDNCSTDDSYAKLQGLISEKIILIQTDRNGGYGYGNNFGARYIKEAFQSDYILLANPDVVFSNPLIQRFVDLMEERPELALVSAIQHDINNQPIQDLAWRVPTSFEYAILNSGKFSRFFPTTYQLDFSHPVQYVDCVPGALLLFDTDRFLQVGGYDEEMFLFGEETTLGFKLKEAGYKSLLVLDDFYRHEHSTSINKSIAARSKQLEILFDSRLLFMKKYLKSNRLMLALASFFQKRTLRKLRDQEK